MGRVTDCRFPTGGSSLTPTARRCWRRPSSWGGRRRGDPHFEFTREYGVESLHIAFRLAQQYDRPLDIHCDEIDDEQSRFVETVAALALKAGIGPRVTASHTTAMHSYNGAYTSRLFRLLKLSGINFVANPLVNIHLQGRFDDYPKRRALPG